MNTHHVALILELQDRRHRAMVEANLLALELLLDEGLVYSHSDGSRDDKPSYLAKVRGRQMRYREIVAVDQEVVSLGGSTSCVLGRMSLVGSLNGTEKRLDNRFLAVWVRRQEGWRLAAFQPTPLTSDA